MTPLISICIPTYNGEKYIAEAMDSAIVQTYNNLEIIISDDASKDAGLEIIESYKEKTDIPIYIYPHQPKGIGANWNHCIKKANGEYIKFLFQDDILMPTCIEKMVALATSKERVGLVYCRREIIFDTQKEDYEDWLRYSEFLHTNWDSLHLKEGIEKGTSYLKDKNLLDRPNNKIGEPPAVLLNKKCFEKVGYFNTNLSQTLDFEYWYRLMPYFDVGFVDEELIKFRLHGNQASQINRKRKTKDKKLLPKTLLKTVFWKLHPKQKMYILKEVCYIPEIKKLNRRIKKRIIKIFS